VKKKLKKISHLRKSQKEWEEEGLYKSGRWKFFQLSIPIAIKESNYYNKSLFILSTSSLPSSSSQLPTFSNKIHI
jgi:hypothetical protein